jgi:DNA replication and repair protein RecF
LHVRRLELVDFRSYPRADVDFEPGYNVLVGANGMGKTNLVEALGYVATLASHRVSTDAPLVRAGATRAVVRAAVVHDGRELLVELELVPGKANRARLGRSPVARARDVIGALRLVMFAPEDLALVRGDPSERRRYLDDLLVARQPRYAGVRADYERVLKQRNALLRTSYLTRKVGRGGRLGRWPAPESRRDPAAGSGAPVPVPNEAVGSPVDAAAGGDLDTLRVWDEHLARHGAELINGRLELVAALLPHVAKAYDAVSAGKGDALIGYDAHSWCEAPIPTQREEIRNRLLAAIDHAKPAEVERGGTLVGPHRDDIVLTLGELPAKGYASHGECWSYALSLRLAAFELLRSEGVEPVLVLDDVFAELDAGRRERLAELVSPAGQVLVTCAEPADVPAVVVGTRYEVAAGTVLRLG